MKITKIIIIIFNFLIFLSLVLIIFLFLLFDYKKNNNIIIYSPDIFESEDDSSGFPVRFKIPEINIDAAIEYVGITPEGAMDVPKNPDNVAWLSLGPRPGEIGSAVIAGHRDWEKGERAVFFNLSKLKKGDKVYIKDDKGDLISFVVQKTKIYNYLEDASEVFLPSDDKYLNLVTCMGKWDKTNQNYTQRLVVFTRAFNP